MSDLQIFEASFQNGDFEVVPVGTTRVIQDFLRAMSHAKDKAVVAENFVNDLRSIGIRTFVGGV